VRPIEQAHADIAFKIAHLAGKRWLGEAEPFGALGKAQFLGHSDEIPEVTEFDIL
jgi:hypothetical protein